MTPGLPAKFNFLLFADVCKLFRKKGDNKHSVKCTEWKSKTLQNLSGNLPSFSVSELKSQNQCNIILMFYFSIIQFSSTIYQPNLSKSVY